MMTHEIFADSKRFALRSFSGFIIGYGVNVRNMGQSDDAPDHFTACESRGVLQNL